MRVAAVKARRVKQKGRKEVANERKTSGVDEGRIILRFKGSGHVAVKIAKCRERDLRDGHDATVPSLKDDPPRHIARRADNSCMQHRKLQPFRPSFRKDTTNPRCEAQIRASTVVADAGDAKLRVSNPDGLHCDRVERVAWWDGVAEAIIRSDVLRVNA
jgi:hypothetical protein